MLSGLRWRIALLATKAAGGHPALPWSLVLGEILARREYAWKGPEIRAMERDPADGLTRFRIAGFDYWFPDEVTPHMLEGLYKITCHAPHPHHFETSGCRLKPGDVALDGGSFEGFFARFALERGAKVIAVEPWSRMAESLRRTFAPEIAAGRLTVARAALEEDAGEGVLAVDPAYPIAATVNRTATEGDVAERVPLSTLDAVIAASPWGRCDFIKLDIEGSERGAVRGARETLTRDRPRLSVAVYHAPETFLQMRADLRARHPGYHVAAKGIERGLDGVSRPVMLHAWHAGRRENGG